MKTIIAIGGGEIGRPGYKIETEKIDKEIIKYSGKKHPKFLFIPTASSDSELYTETVCKYFGKKLGCKVDVLNLIGIKVSKRKIEDKVFNSDIVYVGGGNTMKMFEVWKKNGVEKILKKAWEKGIIISGLSAGAVCWFEYFSSDSKKFINGKENFEMIKLGGLGWLPMSYCPHFDTEKKRKPHLRTMMKDVDGMAIAVENCCAIVIKDDEFRIINSKKGANAYKAFWLSGKYYVKKLNISKKFKPINDLLLKSI
ncbi:peptidase E [Patescibacteria group bacterium]|nr:peptidase E [Patescibacteria group bacterium]MBU1870668.1 peptidase E [Patescibacteria group bacterium]